MLKVARSAALKVVPSVVQMVVQSVALWVARLVPRSAAPSVVLWGIQYRDKQI